MKKLILISLIGTVLTIYAWSAQSQETKPALPGGVTVELTTPAIPIAVSLPGDPTKNEGVKLIARGDQTVQVPASVSLSDLKAGYDKFQASLKNKPAPDAPKSAWVKWVSGIAGAALALLIALFSWGMPVLNIKSVRVEWRAKIIAIGGGLALALIAYGAGAGPDVIIEAFFGGPVAVGLHQVVSPSKPCPDKKPGE